MNDLIRTHEATSLVGVSPRTFNRLTAAAGITPAYRDPAHRGRPAYWRRREIEALRDQYSKRGAKV